MRQTPRDPAREPRSGDKVTLPLGTVWTVVHAYDTFVLVDAKTGSHPARRLQIPMARWKQAAQSSAVEVAP